MCVGLDVATEVVRPKFLVSDDGVSVSWAHGEANTRWLTDMRRWDTAVYVARSVGVFCGRFGTFFTSVVARVLPRRIADVVSVSSGDPESLYAFSALNPFNFVSARRFASLCGCSAAFWDGVVVPVYSSSFLTAEMDEIPASILPALDNIISVGARHPVRPLHTRSQCLVNSNE